jgi:hypothetical protein
MSDMGPDGTSINQASEPSVAFNAQANEYLVVWKWGRQHGAARRA